MLATVACNKMGEENQKAWCTKDQKLYGTFLLSLNRARQLCRVVAKPVSAATFRDGSGDKASDKIHALHYLYLKYTYVFFLSFCEDAQNYFIPLNTEIHPHDI